MDMRLEVVVLPVTDVDRAKAFYEQAGFRLDTDFSAGDEFRVVQVTPPGSACSVSFGVGVSPAAPGSFQGLHLVVTDLEAALADLAGRDIDVSGPFHFGPEGQTPGLDPERRDYGSYAAFSDPDGNGWLLQEVRQPAPGRGADRPPGLRTGPRRRAGAEAAEPSERGVGGSADQLEVRPGGVLQAG